MIIRSAYMTVDGIKAAAWSDMHGQIGLHLGYQILSIVVTNYDEIRIDYVCNENRPLAKFDVTIKVPGNTVDADDILAGKLEGFLADSSDKYVYLRET